MNVSDIAGMQVSGLCLGTMYFGTTVAKNVAYDLLDAYVAAGGNFLDTANKYASWIPGFVGGESERLIGGWLRERGNRQRLVIASKVGLAMPGVESGLKAQQIIAQCEASLSRLGIEAIDILYAHADDRSTPLEESMAAFSELVRAGKIRACGASNYQAWRLALACAAARAQHGTPFSCAQFRHSYLRADPWIPQDFTVQIPATPELLDCCRTNGLRTLAYSPLLGGAYARADRPLPAAYRTEANQHRLSVLRQVAEARGATTNQIVLAWLSSGPQPTIPVIAASRLEQLQENLLASTVVLHESERAILDQAGVV